MDNKEKPEPQGETQRKSRSYLFACFPVSRRNSMQFLSSVIFAPHAGSNGSETWHRGKSRHSNKSSLPYSGPIFSKVLPHTGRHSFQEPTSPEVTCFGQVRVKEKQYKAWDASLALNRSFDLRHPKLQNTSSETKRRSASFRGPRESTWRQLLGSKGSVSPQACPTDGTDEIGHQRFGKIKLSPSRSMNSAIGTAFEESVWQRQNENDQLPENRKEQETDKDTIPCNDSLAA